MICLLIDLKNFLYHGQLCSKRGLIFVLTFFSLAMTGANGHETSHERHEEKNAGPPAEKIAPNVLAAISVSIGDSATDQPIARWLTAVKQQPKSDIAWVNLGNALMQKVRESWDEGRYGQAEYAYLRALDKNPENVAAVVGMSWVYGGLHQFGHSIEWANKALLLDPQNPEAHGLIADAKVEWGDYKAAEGHIQKMLDSRPDLSSYSRAAHLLFLTGDVQKGIWLMQKAINAGGPYAENTAWCRAQLAMMLWNTGALALAERELEKAIKTAPDNYYVLEAMGKIKSARKDYDAAIENYKKAIAITPRPKTFVALGDLYLLKGENEQAEAQFRRIENPKNHSTSHSHPGDILLASFYADHDRNLEIALTEAEAAYTVYKNVFVTDTLAWCYYKNGRYQEAKKAIQSTLKWKTPDANILFHAGMIYAKLSEYTTAKNFLYQALSLNPNFHPINARVAADTLKALRRSGAKS